jgi:L-lactate dehydrogenase complex protein LldG
LARLELTELLARHGIADLRHQQLAALPEPERRTAMLAADIGISSADYAIAETGTLAVFARAGQERVISLVPPVHIAVLAADQVLPDLFDLFGELAQRKPEELPSNVALISGPSKTGDVELELTTGVHGPGHWHVVIVRVNNGP